MGGNIYISKIEIEAINEISDMASAVLESADSIAVDVDTMFTVVQNVIDKGLKACAKTDRRQALIKLLRGKNEKKI